MVAGAESRPLSGFDIEVLLHTTCVKELKRYPVSRLFNRVENNSRECMEPLKVNVSAGSRESGTKKA